MSKRKNMQLKRRRIRHALKFSELKQAGLSFLRHIGYGRGAGPKDFQDKDKDNY